MHDVQQTVDKTTALLRRVKQRPNIHFKKFDHATKRAILRFLSTSNWKGLVLGSDTTKIIDGSALVTPTYQYNYALRYVIERISSYAESCGEKVDEVIIENRRNFKLSDFQAYLRKLHLKSEPRIKWQFCGESRVTVKGKHECSNLCIADGLAHSLFKALEPDCWGHYESAYLEGVWHKLWRIPEEGCLYGYGLTLIPTKELGTFTEEYDWLNERQ